MSSLYKPKEECLIFRKCDEKSNCSIQCLKSKCFEVLFNNSNININDYIKVLNNNFMREFDTSKVNNYLVDNNKPFLLLKKSPKSEDRKIEGISILLNYAYNNLENVYEEDVLIYFVNATDMIVRDSRYFDSDILMINYLDLVEEYNNVLSSVIINRCNNYKRTIISFYNKVSAKGLSTSIIKMLMENSI